tara:strand:- start:172 stop:426 length:255 start_codon:yes stop_codon:yes gene_type:complete
MDRMKKTLNVTYRSLAKLIKRMGSRRGACSVLVCLSSFFASKSFAKGTLTYGNIQHLNDPQLDGAGSQWVDYSYFNRKESGRFL